jgi:hypothetical protein
VTHGEKRNRNKDKGVDECVRKKEREGTFPGDLIKWDLSLIIPGGGGGNLQIEFRKVRISYSISEGREMSNSGLPLINIILRALSLQRIK